MPRNGYLYVWVSNETQGWDVFFDNFTVQYKQGPVLEAEGLDVGIVTHIAGIRRLALTFKGQAAHAGTTPLDLRQDALVSAARFVLDLRAALESRPPSRQLVIATVGEIHVAHTVHCNIGGMIQSHCDCPSITYLVEAAIALLSGSSLPFAVSSS